MTARDVLSRLHRMASRSARWIGSDALRELTSEAVRRRLSRRTRETGSGKP